VVVVTGTVVVVVTTGGFVVVVTGIVVVVTGAVVVVTATHGDGYDTVPDCDSAPNVYVTVTGDVMFAGYGTCCTEFDTNVNGNDPPVENDTVPT
jgi:hypothetical protein